MSRPETPEEALEYIEKNATRAAWEVMKRDTVSYRKIKITHLGPEPTFREFSMSKWVPDNEESIKEYQVQAAQTLYDAINTSASK